MTFTLKRTALYILGGAILLAGLVLWLAPLEKTLGNGIKYVYVHVAFTWTGMLLLGITGLLGLGTMLLGKTKWEGWRWASSWVGLGFYIGGFGMSMLASKVNWGAVYWAEPRTVVALQVLAIALIVQVINSWPVSVRLQGGLHFGLALYLFWATRGAELVVHPDNPIGTSTSSGIQVAFGSMFFLSFMMALSLIVLFAFPHQRPSLDG